MRAGGPRLRGRVLGPRRSAGCVHALGPDDRQQPQGLLRRGAGRGGVDHHLLVAPEGIRVNAIAPGSTLTEMVRTWEEHSPGLTDRMEAAAPLGRMAEPEEIAQAAAWLLSDRSSYVTGAVLPVDAGLRA
ncbi:SDR family oxidoreductase [Streptomonospora sp. PA3]|nr:SDR family oxidoreductase [Streptomonospora sp. PA3]